MDPSKQSRQERMQRCHAAGLEARTAPEAQQANAEDVRRSVSLSSLVQEHAAACSELHANCFAAVPF